MTKPQETDQQSSRINYPFSVGDYKFLISERKYYTPSKPRFFIRQIKPVFEYISSLYPVGDGWYSGDYKNAYFKIKLDNEGVPAVLDQFTRLVGQIEAKESGFIGDSQSENITWNISEPVQQ